MTARETAPSHGFRHFRTCLVAWCLAACFSGCVSGNLVKARSHFYTGRPDQAAEALPDPQSVRGRDRLLYYMDKGLILHHLAKYEESVQTLLQAVQLMEEQDYISAGEQAVSLVTTEWMTEYKGEYAERLLIHTYLMMNFLLLGQYESSLVEAKQALKIYDRYPEACKNDYFTRALIALSFEIVGDINGAYIEYKKLASAMPDPAPVAAKLYSLGMQLGFDDEAETYRQYAPDVETEMIGQNSAEVILFVSQGMAPVKIPQNIVLPPSIRFSFSTYLDRSHYFNPPEIRMVTDAGKMSMVTTDMGRVLKDSLQDRLAQILVKETARVAAKEAIAQNVKDDEVEILVRIVLFLLEQPDTRCWETLPGYMTLVRIPVAPGQRRLTVHADGGPGGCVDIPEINVTPGRKFYFYSIFSGATTTTAAD
jgi:hypothetical protein